MRRINMRAKPGSDLPRSTQELRAISATQAEKLLFQADKMEKLIKRKSKKEVSDSFEDLKAVNVLSNDA